MTVGDNWGAGAYVTAMLYRPLDESLKRMPSRAIGVQWLGLDQAANTLNVELGTPEKIKSGTTLTVPVKIGGLKAGEEARVTLAAVDLGILNLTRFQTPAPENWFYAQRRMGLEIRDFYGRLIDGMRAERGTLRSGGDGGADAGLQGSPPVEETVAMFSGIVSVGPDGTASVDFDVPDFNGTVRVMAVAWSADKLGHGQQDVIVRDAVALTASGPRFLTLGDEARLDIAVHNVEGPQAAYKLELTNGDKSVHTASLDLKANERRSEHHPGEADRRRPRRLRHPRHRPRRHRRQASPDVRREAAGRRHQAHDGRVAEGRWQHLAQPRPRARHDRLAARAFRSASARRQRSTFPSLLTSLDRYPYGCAEQTVSRALPLVYANAVAAQLGIAPDKELKARVQKAVDRVFEMQDSTGAFGVWGPSHHRSLADGLRHRLPDAREGARLRGQSAGLHPGARPAAELHRLRRGLPEGRRGPGLCALRSRPQRPRADRRPALLRRHAPRPLLDAARQGPDRRRARHDGRQDTCRDGVRLGAR